jgi:N-acetylmuramoyl-L-alanine amidase
MVHLLKKHNMANRKIALLVNAGHGGIDPETGLYTTPASMGKRFKHPVINNQTFHNDGWFYEGVFNRSFAAEFIAQAQRNGYLCFPVYHPWNDTALNVRTDLANHIQKSLGIQSVYLSFHSNAGGGAARGFRNFHHHNSSNSKLLAQCISSRVAPYCESWGSSSTNPTREAWIAENPAKGPMWETEQTNMFANLLELLFFDNYEDATLLMNKEFCSGLAHNALNGVYNFEQQKFG